MIGAAANSYMHVTGSQWQRERNAEQPLVGEEHCVTTLITTAKETREKWASRELDLRIWVFFTPIVHFRWWKDTFRTMVFYFIRWAVVSPKKIIFSFAIATYIIIRRCLKVMKFRSNCWIDDDFIFTRWGSRKGTDCSHSGYVSLEPLCVCVFSMIETICRLHVVQLHMLIVHA